MNSNLPVSVLIAAYNAEKYVAETINSVLQQTQQPTEIIVIDDGSTDDTKSILETFRDKIRIISRENRGVPRSVNQAIQLSTQPLICFLDADDLWHPDKLKTQYQAYTAAPDIVLLFGHIKQFISPELSANAKSKIYYPEKNEQGWVRGSMMCHRSLFKDIGKFDESLKHGDFIDWFGKVKQSGIPYKMLDEVVIYRRLHPNGLSNILNHRSDFVTILKKRLDKARKNQ
ncbi:MAG: glycosyltransferase involved in cell wall biosynthesis [Spirosomataceae bacterium]|jgi:glycosyltransferase involved in cell wall biosynthesis